MASPIYQLSIRKAFEELTQKEKFYAHYMARAAWHGTRILLRQVSFESIAIFDFIVEVFRSQSGGWAEITRNVAGDSQDFDGFLKYSSTFLANIGNYYGYGDHKIMPDFSIEYLKKVASVSPRATELYQEIGHLLFSRPPFGLGYPSDTKASAYYPGSSQITSEEVSMVSRVMEQHQIYPENTRVRKTESGGHIIYDILQASIETDSEPIVLANNTTNQTVRLIRGDHAEELREVCVCLRQAAEFAASPRQSTILDLYCKSFETGSLHIYRESLREWVVDRSPRVESIFGFVEPYRDPHGVRGEWQGTVGFSSAEETKLLNRLVDNSKNFIRRLPWAKGTTENDGKGPFEKEMMDPPDFASLHGRIYLISSENTIANEIVLVYCSSYVWTGQNLPNYNDIRQNCGFKNVIFANQMSAFACSLQPSPFMDKDEAKHFQKYWASIQFTKTVLHELLGHGTGKMMMEEANGKFNFDPHNPPVNPSTGNPITSWYKPGQTWSGQFEKLAGPVEECRADLVALNLMHETDVLALFGFEKETKIRAIDFIYNMYLYIGHIGLKALSKYDISTNKWGQAHSRGHFAVLRCLLLEGDGFMKIEHDSAKQRLTIRVDRERIFDVAKPVLSAMLLRLHMYRVTAAVADCRAYFENLTKVEGEHLEWRKIVEANGLPNLEFVQANTFIEGDEVVLREYEPTPEGMLQSWADRNV